MNGDPAETLEKLAEILLAENKVFESFQLFINALRANPELKTRLKYSFTTVVCSLGRILEDEGDYEELFACYEQALCVFSENEAVRTNLGAHLHRLGFLVEACNSFRKALDINSTFLRAKNNLENLYCTLVDRWHFRMLNDKNRNEMFKKAIAKKVKLGHKHVLDIGCGTGILSLFAADGGATSVHACDGSQTMIEISQEVIAANHVSSKVHLLNKYSYDIHVPDDIPNRVSLVITETFDAALFGEKILQTLVHAWEKLLLPPHGSYEEALDRSRQESGCVIPCAADLWIAPIECEYINIKYRLQRVQHSSSSDFLDDVNFDLFSCDEEPYDTIDLDHVPGSYRLLSPPIICMRVNFNDYDGMVKLLQGRHDYQNVEIRCSESGRVDAFAVWFTLHLDENSCLTSAPGNSPNKAPCWDQAIFPMLRPILVTNGSELPLRIDCQEGILKISLLPPTFQNSYLPLMQDQPVYSAPSDVVTFLNDKDWMRALKETYTLLSLCVRQSPYDVLDLSPFPVLGLTILRHRETSRGSQYVRLMCLVEERKDETIIRTFAREKGIPQCQIECLQLDALEERLDGSRKFDLIIFSPVESKGCLNDKHIQLLPLLSEHLKEGGSIIPQEIKVCALLLESQWLREVSLVLGPERVCGYNIAPFINKYKTAEHLDTHADAVPHRGLSHCIEVPLTCEDLLRSIEEPLSIEEDVCLQSDGCITAVGYWFKVKYLVTSPEISTKDVSSFAKQSFVLIDPQIEVHTGEKIKFELLCHQGYTKMVLNTINSC